MFGIVIVFINILKHVNNIHRLNVFYFRTFPNIYEDTQFAVLSLLLVFQIMDGRQITFGSAGVYPIFYYPSSIET